MVTLFNKLKKDGDVTYLSLVVPDEDSVHFYIDALVEELGDDPANQIAYGSDILYTDAANPMILLTWRNILPYGTNISRIKVWIIRL